MLGIFNIDIRLRSVVCFSSSSFSSGETSHRHAMNRRMWNPEPVWTFQEREIGRKRKVCLTTYRVASINRKFYLNPLNLFFLLFIYLFILKIIRDEKSQRKFGFSLRAI